MWLYVFLTVCSPPRGDAHFREHTICLGLNSLKTPELSCPWFHHSLTRAGECQGFPLPSVLPPLGEGSPGPSREQSRLLPERVHRREAWPWKCCSQGCFIPWHVPGTKLSWEGHTHPALGWMLGRMVGPVYVQEGW